ncbi:hypothetical protein PF008_g18291 [Phytophthora fragariae]|uniref:Uncharacterized protein n=1 Tax=Phytophthora fragariae TaxID=53985 RepID=A0A6G0R5S4_9STRA|nr:hypothetical protein PF008_g18291 [Phytophthora fragariae]
MKVANASDDGHYLPTTKHPVDASTSIPPIEFQEWSGMAAIVTGAWSTVGFGDAAGVNGWAVLVGNPDPDSGSTKLRLASRPISGLLLASIRLLSRADVLNALTTSEPSMVAVKNMVMACVMVPAKAYRTPLASSVRRMVCLYGAAIAATFSIVITGVCGGLMHYINVTFLVSECHVVHGWFAKHRSEFDLALPFQKLEALADTDARYQQQSAGKKRSLASTSRPTYGLFSSSTKKLPIK